MARKFSEEDEVIFIGNAYPKHRYHKATVVDVLIKRRDNYPGTKVNYLVHCECGGEIKPESYSLELLS